MLNNPQQRNRSIKAFKRIVRILLGIILSVYFGLIILLNIPYIQRKSTAFVEKELSAFFDAKVSIGKIDMGLLNRIIIDDLQLNDRTGTEMIRVSRLSAKFNFLPLLKGRISIGSVQLFGFNISLNKQTPEDQVNLQFVIDAFAPKDSLNKDNNLDLRINSLLVRRGRLSYDVHSAEETPGRFNPKHIRLYNIIANISLKALTADSINAQVKRLSVDEQSGVELRKLSLKVLGNQNNMTVENFEVSLPNTLLRADTIRMTYDSLTAFNRFVTDVNFSFSLLPTKITLQDISPFIPLFTDFKESIDLELTANGTLDQLNVPQLTMYAGNVLKIKGDVAFNELSDPYNAFIFGKLSQLSVNEEGLDFLARNFSQKYERTPAQLKNLGFVSFRGEVSGYFSDLVTYGTFQTDLGSLKADVKVSSDREKGSFSYSGLIKTDMFEMGKWLNSEKLGHTAFDLRLNGSTYSHRKYPSINLKGLVSTIEYSDYAYENITLDGEYKNGGFNGLLILDDDNGSLHMNGSVNLASKVPTFNFSADIKKVRPYHLNLTKKYEDTEFSMKINANFEGGSIDEIIGTIDIDSIDFNGPDKSFFSKNIKLLATREEDKNKLMLRSDFINADIEGNYSYRTLPQSIRNVALKYIPALFTSARQVETQNNVSFDIYVFNTEILPVIFDIPLKTYTASTIKGYFNDRTGRIRLEGYFPRFRYDNMFIESGMVLLENPSDELYGRLRFTNYRTEGSINLSIETRGKNNQLTTRLNWGNNAVRTFSGDIFSQATFVREGVGNAPLKSVIDINPSDMILNDTIWKLSPAQVVVDNGKVSVDNIHLYHNDQFLRINGIASEEATDTVHVDLNGINMGYIFDVINLKAVDFKGMASGRAFASNVFTKPEMNTRLQVQDFSYNSVVLGDMDIYGKWVPEEEGIWLDAAIKGEEEARIDAKGYIYPLKPKSGLDLRFAHHDANVKFVEYFTSSIISDISGKGSGNIRLFGEFSELNLEGSSKLDAKFKVNTLNTHFALKDSVFFSDKDIALHNVTLYDANGNRGKANGYIRHSHFRDMTYRLNVDASNMLVMNTTEDPELPFYGMIYATGSALIRGSEQEVVIDATLRTNKNTNFIYTIISPASATSNDFIRFVDVTPNINNQNEITLLSDFDIEKRELEEVSVETDIRLNIQVEATPDANVKIIMDPASDDHITAKGSGNLRLEYYNKGDVNIFGDYNISQGLYKFSLQEVIRKDFQIKEGSNITFGGNPYNAMMNINAIYTVNSASLTDLVPEDELSNRSISRNVRVNCIMGLSGSLRGPNVHLNIDLPNASSEAQNLVKNYVRTDEDTNTQVLYLLAIGKFYTPDYVDVSQSSNRMSSVLSSTLSGQLNRILSQTMDNNNWTIGTNLSTGDKGWSDVEIEGMLSGQLLNNRLIINGNFGYRDNPLLSTNFVGDFDAEYLLTRSGEIRLKAYNETNDRYYTRSNPTTQGIGIIYRKDFNRWRDLLFWQRRRRPVISETEEARPDSISAGLLNDSIRHEFITFK